MPIPLIVWLIGAQVLSYLVAWALTDDPPSDDGSGEPVKKGSTTVAEEGGTVPLVFGTCRVERPNIINWSGTGSVGETLKESYVEDGKEGGHSIWMQLGVCIHPIQNAYIKWRRIWIGPYAHSTLGYIPYSTITGATEADGFFDTFKIAPEIDNPTAWSVTTPNSPRDGYGPGKILGRNFHTVSDFTTGTEVVTLVDDGTYIKSMELISRFYLYNGGHTHGENAYGYIINSAHKGVHGGTWDFAKPIVYINDLYSRTVDIQAVSWGISDVHYGGLPGVANVMVRNWAVGNNPIMPGISFEMSCTPDFTGVVRSTVGGLLGGDANPAAVIYQILTNTFIGLGIDPSTINIPSFDYVGGVLDTEVHGFSAVFTKPMEARKMIGIVLKQIDGLLYVDQETAQITLKLARADYGTYPYPALAVYDDSNVEEVIDYKVTEWVDTYNEVRLRYEDRDTSYEYRFAIQQSTKSGEAARSTTMTFPGVKTAALANTICARELSFYATPHILVTLAVNREANVLRPGDVFKWTVGAPYNITNMILRVVRITLGTLHEGLINLQCTQDKYANIIEVFSNPNLPWIDTVVVRPSAPDLHAVVEYPPNPMFRGLGTPSVGGVMVLVGTLDGDGSTNNVRTRSDSLNEYGFSATAAAPVTGVPSAQVSTAYTTATSPYYDTTTGLVIKGVSNVTILRTSSVADVRAGRAVILVGDEFMSYESFTDLGGGSYRLNNVWRGLFDTTYQTHDIDKSIFFLYNTDMGRLTLEKKFLCTKDVVFKHTASVLNTKYSGSPIPVFGSVAITNRIARPARPVGFTLVDDGADLALTTPEVDYAYDVTNPRATELVVAPGFDGKSSGSAFGDVWTNDLRGTWRRRPLVLGCTNMVVRGDDADQPFGDSDGTRLQVSGRGTQEVPWRVLAKHALNGVDDITAPTDFIDVSEMPVGDGILKLSAYNALAGVAGGIESRTAETISVAMHSSRQLLLNRKFRPWWDTQADSGGVGKVFGAGLYAPGNATGQARAWRSTADPKGGDTNVVRYEVFAHPLNQKASGHSFVTTIKTIGEFSHTEQIVPVPYSDTQGSELVLSMWCYRPSNNNNARYYMSVQPLDSQGVSLGAAATSTVAPLWLTSSWGKVTQSLTAMSPAAVSIRVTVGLTTDTLLSSREPAISDVCLTMGRSIKSNSLTNGSFDTDLSAWTATPAASWVQVAVVGTLLPVNNSNVVSHSPNGFAKCNGVDKGLLETTHTVPAAYNTNDYVRLQWWSATPLNSSDVVACSISIHDLGNNVIAVDTLASSVSVNDLQWYFHEQYLKLPSGGVYVKVEFQEDGTGNDVCIDDVDLSYIKASAFATELTWTQARLQPMPVTPGAFAIAAGDEAIRPCHIFPMQDGAGVFPVDVIQDVAWDVAAGVSGKDYDLGSPSYGMYRGSPGGVPDHTSGKALEFSTTLGGVTTLSTDFLDPGHASIGIYMHYQLVEGSVGKFNILSKGASHHNLAVGENYFGIHYDPLEHKIYFDMESYQGGVYSTFSTYMVGDIADGAHHWLYASINFAAGTVQIWGDTSAGTSVDISAELVSRENSGQLFENRTHAAAMGRNESVTLGATYYADGPEKPFKCSYLAVLRGSSAERFTRSMGQSMWRHGQDHNLDVTGSSITYTRGTRAAYEIDDGKVAMWSGSSSGAPVGVPLKYANGYTAPYKLGLGTSGELTNLIASANELGSSAWVKVNTTINTGKIVSERGFREMYVLAPIYNGGYVYKTVYNILPETVYTFSVFARAETGTHTAHVDITTADNTTTMVTLVLAGLTTTIKRYSLTFTTAPAQTMFSVRMRGGIGPYGAPGSSKSHTGYHGAMITKGSNLGPVIYNDMVQATNLIAPYANDLRSVFWTKVNTTVLAAPLISERGIAEMDVLAPLYNGGYVYKTVYNILPETVYTFSVFARAETGTHTAHVDITTANNTTTMVTLVLVGLTTTIQRYSLTFTTAPAQTMFSVRMRGGIGPYGAPGSSKSHTGYHGVMITKGSYLWPAVYATGGDVGTETLGAQTQELTTPSNSLTSPDEGSIYAKFVQSVGNTGGIRTLAEVYGSNGSSDGRVIRVDQTGTQSGTVLDGAGATYQTIPTSVAALVDGVETERLVSWRRKANLAAGAYTVRDEVFSPPEVRTAVGTANTESTGGHTVYKIAGPAGESFSGSLQTLRFYTGEVRDKDA